MLIIITAVMILMNWRQKQKKAIFKEREKVGVIMVLAPGENWTIGIGRKTISIVCVLCCGNYLALQYSVHYSRFYRQTKGIKFQATSLSCSVEGCYLR